MEATKDPGPILVVDDDRLVCEILAEVLEGAGARAAIAGSAEQAAELLACKPLMAFVDLNLPGEQGDVFCRTVRLHPERWDLPVVMMTGADTDESVRRCFMAGADDYLVKPLLERHVLAKVAAVRSSAGEAAPQPSRHKRVLIVTERNYFGTVVSRLLQQSGFESSVATQLTQLTSAGGEGPIRLAIVDLDAPAASEVVGRLRAEAPPIPIVAVTSRPLSALPAQLAALAPYDLETELEHLVRRVNKVLIGSGRSDRRSAPRIPFHSVVQFRLWGEEEWRAGGSFDLSETGLYVRTLTPMQASKPVEITFSLGRAAAPLTVKGLVVWSNSFGPRTVFSYPYGMGVTFSDFPVAEWTKLREFIQARRAEG
ncbi:MAG: response regulator [Deltaproteobacteria bacterium]|nr:response regulator [Deltaproteobacteria bacterium]